VPYAHVAARTEREARHTFLLLLIGLGVLWLALFPIVLAASRRLRRNALEIRRQSTHDALTGLPTGGLPPSVCGTAVEEGHGLVALIDVDRFKDINDTLGHPRATSCCARWACGWPTGPAARPWWRGWGATSSRC